MLVAAANEPEISVIIPTYGRPDLVVKAVASAAAQTIRDLEIVVAVDGGDPKTLAALEGMDEPRLRILPLDRRRGNAGARNAGIAAARAPWIALLDDDDSWRPEKLARQIELAREAGAAFPIVCCRFEAVGNGARFVWPAALPRPGQPISEYLFTRRGPAVTGAVQTSTFLVRRALFERVPFDEALNRYVDLDWLLRAARIDGVELVFVPGDPLSTYHIDDDRSRISNELDWQRDIEWIQARRDLVTARAYGGYLLTQASIRAEKSRDRGAFFPLLREAVSHGRVSAGEVAFHTGNTFLPRALRRSLTSRPKAN